MSKKIVVIARPGKKAEVTRISTDYRSLSKIVGGMIECTHPFSDDVAVISNDNSIALGMLPNRGIYDDAGNLVDIYRGTMIFVGDRPDDEDYSSLTDTEIAVVMLLYGDPDIRAEKGKDGRWKIFY